MEKIFVNGTYRGEGRWLDQKAEGGYTAQYRIMDGDGGSKVHEVERIFFKPDGSVAYEERSTVNFRSAARGIQVTIGHGEREVKGAGYALDRDCHYDADVAADNHLEFTFHAEDARITGLGSATNKGNLTYWKETLLLV